MYKSKRTRVIESMGTGLVLCKVYSIDKHIGFNYHYFFENKKKPPFDLAINPDNGEIEYISFFLQDEKLKHVDSEIEVEFINESHNIPFATEDFSQDNSEEVLFKEFDLLIDDKNNIWAIHNSNEKSLRAYKISDNDYILLNAKDEFEGVLLMNIATNEIQALAQSYCIVPFQDNLS